MATLKAIALSLLLAVSTIATPLQNNAAKRQSSIPIGSIISSCTVPGTVALTFDDGPYIYTDELLNILASNGVLATFFVNGQNFGAISDYASTVQRAASAGHQIGSHTWNHADLATLDAAGITSEMTQLEDALVTILGYYPQYMRPPYFSTNALVLQTLGSLGYHVVQADIDTLDYENDSPALIQNAYNNFVAGLNNGGSIELSHDVHQNTVETLVQEMINEVRNRGLNPVTVGECLGDPSSNWYRTSRGGTTPPPNGGGSPGGGTTSPDSTCGGTTGFVCPAGECCSQYGWCGTTPDYCGTSPPPSGGSSPGGTTSPDGTCGGSTGFVCATGECCSQYGWCGTTSEYCG